MSRRRARGAEDGDPGRPAKRVKDEENDDEARDDEAQEADRGENMAYTQAFDISDPQPASDGEDEGSDGEPVHSQMANGSSQAGDEEALQQLRAETNSEEFARAGIIRRIELVNFRVHEHLAIDLNPNINFITGDNGSGKSSILIGIQTCFGCSAADTNAGSALSQLIRRGCEWGRVRVTLANEGEEAYMRRGEPGEREFGKTITVERTISKSGNKGNASSTYKLYDQHGKVVPSKRPKDELDRILSHFNILPRNPCVIMNQDTCREFLQSNKMEDKYKFFLRATQLEQIEGEIESARSNNQAFREQIVMKQQGLPEMQQRMRKAEAEYKKSQKMESYHKQAEVLGQRLAWAVWEEKVHEVEKQEFEVSQVERKIEATEAKREKRERERQELLDAALELKADMEKAQEQSNEIEKLLQAVRKKLKDTKAQDKKNHKALASDEAYVKSAEKELRGVQAQIRAIREESSRDFEKEARVRQDKKDKLQEQVRAAKSSLREAEAAMVKIDEEMSAVSEELNALPSLYSVEQQVIKAKRDLQQAKLAQKGDPLQRFGNEAVALKKELPRIQGVLGPIGAHIKIKKEYEQFALAIESGLGEQLLNSYVAKDAQSKDNLLKTMRVTHRSTKFKPSVISQKWTDNKYAYNKEASIKDLSMVYEMIEVDNPWIHNVLIDQSNCEKWAVVQDLNEAHDLTLKRELKGVYVIKPQNKGRLTVTKVRRMGAGQTLSSKQLFAKGNLLTTDLSGYISQIEARLQELQAQVHSDQSERKVIQDKRKALKNQKVVKHRECRKLKIEIDALQTRIKAIDDEAQAEVVEDVSVYEQEERDLKNQISERKQDIAEKIQASGGTDVRELLKQLKKEESELEARAHETIASSKKQRAKTGEITEAAVKKSVACKRYANEVEQAKRDLLKEKALVEKGKVAVEKALKEAKEVCPERIDTRGAKPIKLQSELLAVHAVLEEEKRRNGNVDPTTLFKKFIAEEKKFEDTRLGLKALNNQRKAMKDRVALRKDEHGAFLKSVSNKAKKFFTLNLQSQGHNGLIEFDHDLQTLQLVVTPNATAEAQNATSDTKALSGGERAYTTLSFVLALGECMSSPIRAMDEFDVFMDSVNRDISMKLLITCCSQTKNRQFIFLTPLDATTLKPQRNLSILALGKVDRGQEDIRDIFMQ